MASAGSWLYRSGQMGAMVLVRCIQGILMLLMRREIDSGVVWRCQEPVPQFRREALPDVWILLRNSCSETQLRLVVEVRDVFVRLRVVSEEVDRASAQKTLPKSPIPVCLVSRNSRKPHQMRSLRWISIPLAFGIISSRSSSCATSWSSFT